jgi:hypothetical protein
MEALRKRWVDSIIDNLTNSMQHIQEYFSELESQIVFLATELSRYYQNLELPICSQLSQEISSAEVYEMKLELACLSELLSSLQVVVMPGHSDTSHTGHNSVGNEVNMMTEPEAQVHVVDSNHGLELSDEQLQDQTFTKDYRNGSLIDENAAQACIIPLVNLLPINEIFDILILRPLQCIPSPNINYSILVDGLDLTYDSSGKLNDLHCYVLSHIILHYIHLGFSPILRLIRLLANRSPDWFKILITSRCRLVS